jgi:hypothetical protein
MNPNFGPWHWGNGTRDPGHRTRSANGRVTQRLDLGNQVTVNGFRGGGHVLVTGLRDGEKLFEELSYPNEEIQPTASAKIGRIRGTPEGWLDLSRHLRELRQSMSARGDAAIRKKVKEIVPEYSPNGGSGTSLVFASVNLQTNAAPSKKCSSILALQ